MYNEINGNLINLALAGEFDVIVSAQLTIFSGGRALVPEDLKKKNLEFKIG